jgi:predicted O-methyltransferase YrrM
MLEALTNRLREASDHIRTRLADSRLNRRIADLPRDAGADEVVDFLFSPAARGIEAWQIPEEFRALARLVERRRPRAILEIGTADGGTLFAHARLAHEEALIVSLDLPEGPFGGGYPAWRAPLYRSFAGPRQEIALLCVDSHAGTTVTALAELLGDRRIDYAFIDGDHSYDGVRQDFELCMRFAADDAVIALHDIAPLPNPEWVRDDQMTAADGATRRFWQEVRREYAHEEFIHDVEQEGYGIGVLYIGAAVDPSTAAGSTDPLRSGT